MLCCYYLIHILKSFEDYLDFYFIFKDKCLKLLILLISFSRMIASTVEVIVHGIVPPQTASLTASAASAQVLF